MFLLIVLIFYDFYAFDIARSSRDVVTLEGLVG